MQLNEILDENSVSAISSKTNISEDNIEALISSDFEKISRVKAMGFISILEREYHADLSKQKKEALAFYEQHATEGGVTLGLPLNEEKKGKSKLFILITIFLIGYALWYAFDNFDKKALNAMLPFTEEKLGLESKEDITGKDAQMLSIEHLQSKRKTENSDAADSEEN